MQLDAMRASQAALLSRPACRAPASVLARLQQQAETTLRSKALRSTNSLGSSIASSNVAPSSSRHGGSAVPVRCPRSDAIIPMSSKASASAPAPNLSKDFKLTIGLVGFGLFGQFLAKRMAKAGHRVIAWNRGGEGVDHAGIAKDMGVEFFPDMDDFCEEHPEVVILVTSILSTSAVLGLLPMLRLKRSTLFVDVLSVKVFPKQLLLSKLPTYFDILCTHPMFGPNSGAGSWKGLNFQYDKVRIGDEPERMERVNKFLNFFASEGCEMVEMTCEEHDEAAASTQFVTHTVGRMLGTMKLQSTNINTKGFEALLNLVNQTNTDSFDLYYGLFLYNQNATDELERLEKGLEQVKDRLFSQLHDIARKEMFPKGMLEKMLSKSGAKVLKIFFRGLANYGQVQLSSGLSIDAESSIDPEDDLVHEDHPNDVLPLYLEHLTIWRDRALEAAGRKPKQVTNMTVVVDKDGVATLGIGATQALSVFRDAFAFVDIDNSGTISPGEIASRVLKLTDTRATNEELSRMMELADMDGSGSVGFRELVLFCAYEFFVVGSLTPGMIDRESLLNSMSYLELPSSWATPDELDLMLALANKGGPKGRVDVGIKSFASVFEDINRIQVQEPVAAAS